MPYSTNPAISVVAPCLDEEEVVSEFLKRVTGACEATGKSFEIIIVDDGSTDGTWVKLQKYSNTDGRVRALRLARNFGHQAALSAGLGECRGEKVLLIDADLQDPPELLSPMLEIGMKVRGVPFDDGIYMDIGTARELDAALKKFHL